MSQKYNTVRLQGSKGCFFIRQNVQNITGNNFNIGTKWNMGWSGWGVGRVVVVAGADRSFKWIRKGKKKEMFYLTTH